MGAKLIRVNVQPSQRSTDGFLGSQAGKKNLEKYIPSFPVTDSLTEGVELDIVPFKDSTILLKSK